MQINPVSFVYNDGPGDTRYGVLAEAMYLIDPNLVELDADGKPLKVKYFDLGMVTLEAVKELQYQESLGDLRLLDSVPIGAVVHLYVQNRRLWAALIRSRTSS